MAIREIKLRYMFLPLIPIVLWIILVPLLRPVRIELEISEKVPLAAEARIRTRGRSTVSLLVKGKHEGDEIRADFDRSARSHNIAVLGLYPDHENRVSFTVTTLAGKQQTIERIIRTDPLPADYPQFRVKTHLPDKLAPGMLFLHLGAYDEEMNYTPYPSAIDAKGEVRWFYKGDNGHLLRRLSNGYLMIQEESAIVEIDMLGRPSGKSWEVPRGLHHDAVEMENGNFLALGSAEGSFDDEVVEIERTSGEVLALWDFREIVDPERPVMPANLNEKDWLHLNGVIHDSEDDSFIVSGRDQSALIKVDRKSGSLIWILGDHDKWPDRYKPFLLDPVGEGFLWSWGQHAPMLHPEDHSRILLFDNGNKRSYDKPLSPEENFSRIVEYRIDKEAGTVEQLWQYGMERGSELYAPFIGDADYLPGGNRLACFGGVTRDLDGNPMEIFNFEENKVNMMKIRAHIIELTNDTPAKIVQEVEIVHNDPGTYQGYRSYRAEKMSLYP
jgi:arylsulfate sulfotransferase